MPKAPLTQWLTAPTRNAQIKWSAKPPFKTTAATVISTIPAPAPARPRPAGTTKRTRRCKPSRLTRRNGPPLWGKGDTNNVSPSCRCTAGQRDVKNFCEKIHPHLRNNAQFMGGSYRPGNDTSKDRYVDWGNINVNGVVVPDDGIVRSTITTTSAADQIVAFIKVGYMAWYVTVQIMSTEQVWVPDVTWSVSCNVDQGSSQLLSSTCSVGGGTREVNGQQVYSDCWEYTDTYRVNAATSGTCGSLMANPSCTQTSSACAESTNGSCSHVTQTYQCQETFTSTGKLCGGDYFCLTGDCSDTGGVGDSGFDVAVAKLAGLASAGEDVRNDQVNVKAFSGQAMACRKAMAGFSNCCVDSGWGNSAGLANCNSEEMAIGKAKAKKVTVSVGEACAHAVLGVCIQKKQVYCVFGGKLARIIQEQGRRDQLGIGFGSGDSPDCRGITVPELQGINFKLINFSDFYDDLMNNQKIPDSGTMVQQVKDRIAAQVNAQGGGK
ncbi:conjugal transfer protein TraN (plasmid) [Ewingella americana]|nr:conjugal transfer protein TraN [Ewingella americana]